MATSKAPASRSAAAAPAKKSTARGASQSDALVLLATDHKEVNKLFKAYEKLIKSEAESDERAGLSMQICEMLTAHATIEEEIFYPALRDALDADDLLDEAEVEHASAKDLIAQIKSMDPDEALYDAKVTVLGEYIAHHVQEEENEIFPKARKAKVNLQELGIQLLARKQELLTENEPEV
jgi:hemerythrin superfamily protein